MQQPIYLRLSVTDQCNLRCRYCRAAAPATPTDSSAASEDELLALVQMIASECPLAKLRLTGGEPLVYPDPPRLVRRLRAILPAAQIAMTTNALLLRRYAAPLRAAGLDSINISLDTPDEQAYRSLTRGGDLAEAMDGLRAAQEAGIGRIKLNTVLLRTVNGHQLADLARLAAGMGCELRFIELMPTGEGRQWFADDFLGADEALARLAETFSYCGPLAASGTARRHCLLVEGRELTVGFISSVTQPFCDTCHRLRMDCRGRLFFCLRSADGVDLLGPLRGGAPELVRQRIQWAVINKSPVKDCWPTRSMASLGG